jgi:hypothetical protein
MWRCQRTLSTYPIATAQQSGDAERVGIFGRQGSAPVPPSVRLRRGQVYRTAAISATNSEWILLEMR